jgi:HD-GYP domain-containing protein (c-di-GMP phosphodiesterase class II)
MSREDAIAELERCAGSQFDPRVVAALVAAAAGARSAQLDAVA